MGRKKKSVVTDELEAKLLGLAPPAELPPQHQIRDYQQGWDYQRAEEQRQVIANTKPHIYRKSSLKKLAESMPLTSPKKGLYASAMATSSLQSVTLSVDTAKMQLEEGIIYVRNQDNFET